MADAANIAKRRSCCGKNERAASQRPLTIQLKSTVTSAAA
jgi:hypothetical protein